MKTIQLSIIAVVLFSGCASQATLTIATQPQGAYLTEIGSGRAFGMAPILVQYNPEALKQNVNAKGCFLVQGFSAQWVSGATNALNTIELCGPDVGTYNITIGRPAGVPNLEKDLQFAIQIQTLQAQQQQAQAAKDAAAAALWSAWSNSQPISCTSTSIGDTVYTDCK